MQSPKLIQKIGNKWGVFITPKRLWLLFKQIIIIIVILYALFLLSIIATYVQALYINGIKVKMYGGGLQSTQQQLIIPAKNITNIF